MDIAPSLTIRTWTRFEPRHAHRVDSSDSNASASRSLLLLHGIND
jgi:hypothetical protein